MNITFKLRLLSACLIVIHLTMCSLCVYCMCLSCVYCMFLSCVYCMFLLCVYCMCLSCVYCKYMICLIPWYTMFLFLWIQMYHYHYYHCVRVMLVSRKTVIVNSIGLIYHKTNLKRLIMTTTSFLAIASNWSR